MCSLDAVASRAGACHENQLSFSCIPVHIHRACLLAFYAVYFWSERSILKEKTPGWGWFLLLPVVLILPFQILFLLFSDNAILWRGQKIKVKRDGHFEIIQ